MWVFFAPNPPITDAYTTQVNNPLPKGTTVLVKTMELPKNTTELVQLLYGISITT